MAQPNNRPARRESLNSEATDASETAAELRFCHGPSCRKAGSLAVMHAFEEQLGLTVGEADAQRFFSLNSSPCLGVCGNSAAIQLNGECLRSPVCGEVPAFIEKTLAAATGASEIVFQSASKPVGIICAADGPVLSHLKQTQQPLREVLQAGGYQNFLQTSNQSQLLELFKIQNSSDPAAYFFAQQFIRLYQKQSDPSEIIINAHVGVPGDYAERLILERSPHTVLEGALILAELFRVPKVVIFLPAVFDEAVKSVRKALADIRKDKELKPFLKIVQFKVVTSQGAFILAEDSAAREFLSGRVPMPVPKNELSATKSWVMSVQSLLHVLHAAQKGAWPKSWAVSLNAGFTTPGVYEFPGDLTLAEIVEQFGMKPESAVALVYGGPMGRLYLRNEWSHTLATAMSSGPREANQSMILLHAADELDRRVLEFCALESCGKCVPCRVGSFRLLQIKGVLARQQHLPELESRSCAEELANIQEALEVASLCRLGQATGELLRKMDRQ